MDTNSFDILHDILHHWKGQLDQTVMTGSAGARMIEIDLSGHLEVRAVRIAPELWENGDRDILQDLIKAAFSDALAKIRGLLLYGKQS
ncbi:putative nucleoid-associated protein EbfC [Pillotina sp. SPG140]|jgi:DNA-binding YbaB/EbfC family protein